MTEYKRNQRRNKKIGNPAKSNISTKDKISGIFIIVVVFLVSVGTVLYFAFAR